MVGKERVQTWEWKLGAELGRLLVPVLSETMKERASSGSVDEAVEVSLRDGEQNHLLAPCLTVSSD